VDGAGLLVDGHRGARAVGAAQPPAEEALLLRKRPEDLGLAPDGDRSSEEIAAGTWPVNVVDPVWVATEWTLARSIRTARFWWIAGGYLSGLYHDG
jgi:hypothetical protein